MQVPTSLSLRGAVLFLALACAAHAPAQTKKARPAASPAAAKPRAGELSEALGVNSSSPALPEIVATVDGIAIGRGELEKTFTALLSTNGRNPSELSDADRRKGYKSVLEEMVADRLLARESAAEKVDDLEVEKRFDAAKQAFATPEDFDAELKKNGQTVDKVKGNIRAQIRQQQWLESRIGDQITVAPEEAEKFYKENPERFSLPEMIRASHILVAVRRDAPPETALEKEQAANEVEHRLQKGEKFEELAKQFSDDPNAKQTGGDLDFFGRDRIMPEFAEAAFKLKIGEVSPPVRTQFGFHVIKVTDHREPRTATLEEARPQILAFLQDAKRRQAVSDVLTTLRTNAQVDIRIP